MSGGKRNTCQRLFPTNVPVSISVGQVRRRTAIAEDTGSFDACGLQERSGDELGKGSMRDTLNHMTKDDVARVAVVEFLSGLEVERQFLRVRKNLRGGI